MVWLLLRSGGLAPPTFCQFAWRTRTLRAYRTIIDGLIEKHGGRVFNTAEDAVLAEFSSAVEGVRCAITIQEELAVRNAQLPEDKQMHIRIGLNVGVGCAASGAAGGQKHLASSGCVSDQVGTHFGLNRGRQPPSQIRPAAWSSCAECEPTIADVEFYCSLAGAGFVAWQGLSKRARLSCRPCLQAFPRDSAKSDDINRLMPGFTIQGISQITGSA